MSADLRRANENIADTEKQLDRASADLAALEASAIDECEVSRALSDVGPVWDELFPAEQQRIARLLLDRVTVSDSGIDVRLRTGGLRSLVAELQGLPHDEAARTPAKRVGRAG